MIYAFEDYELDTQLFELRRTGEPCRVEPQVFDVLLFLIENRDRIVSKDDLFGHVWKDRFVSDSALSSRLKAARAAIGDGGREQRLIKTLHGRGFRFVGEVIERSDASNVRDSVPAIDSGGTAVEESGSAAPVGRQGELRALQAALDTARTGRRQIVFVTGEAGFGKTTLLQAFLDTVRNGAVRVANGQCLEHHGAGEAYMPILEALGRLCRGKDGAQVTSLLSERAPTWMAQMSWHDGASANEDAQNQLRGGTQDRMLREMVEALEALASTTPLLLVLEDIHWSDPSTVDLLTRLATRGDETRLMVVSTYRLADLKARQQTMYSAVQTLIVRGRVEELALGMLDEDAIGDFLAQRFGPGSFPPELVPVLEQRTHGHPLFTNNVVEHWIADGALVDEQGAWQLTVEPPQLTQSVPPNLRQFIVQFADELDAEDRAILEAAALCGTEFTTMALAACIDMAEQALEARCVSLAQRERWFRSGDIAEFPDGTVSPTFSFNHHLYPEVLGEGVPARQRVRMHRNIGERLEAAYGDRVGDHAAELAQHFVAAHAPTEAIEYLVLSAGQALRRIAPREAVTALRKAIELLPRMPSSEHDRDRLELSLQIMLAPPLIASEGVGSRNAEAAYMRARELCDCVQEPSDLQQVLYGMGAMYEVRGEFTAAEALMHERLELPALENNDLLKVETHELLACSLFHKGEFESSLEQAEAGIRRLDIRKHSLISPAFGENPGISCHFWAGFDLWFLGRPAQALEHVLSGVAMSEHPNLHYSLTTAFVQAAVLHQLIRDTDETIRWAELTENTARQQGHGLRVAMGRVLRGWALALKGDTEAGLDALLTGVDQAAAIGAGMDRSYFLGLLAEAYGAAGRPEDGLQAITEALSALEGRTHFFYAAELYRLQGMLLLMPDTGNESARAEESLQQALDVARGQKAVAMELRAAVSLGQLWRSQGRQADAAALLESAISQYDEQLDSPDLREARELLQTF